MSKNMKKLFLSVYEKDMETQQKLLESSIVKWMGDLDQIDDICVIGAKV